VAKLLGGCSALRVALLLVLTPVLPAVRCAPLLFARCRTCRCALRLPLSCPLLLPLCCLARFAAPAPWLAAAILPTLTILAAPGALTALTVVTVLPTLAALPTLAPLTALAVMAALASLAALTAARCAARLRRRCRVAADAADAADAAPRPRPATLHRTLPCLPLRPPPPRPPPPLHRTASPPSLSSRGASRETWQVLKAVRPKANG